MNIRTLILVAAAALTLSACGSSSEPAATTSPSPAAVQVAYALGTVKKGDQAHCVVCVVNEGSAKEEPVAEVLDYEGKTYAFCNESEKAEFISSPGKYAAK